MTEPTNMSGGMEGNKVCNCPHHKMGAWMILLIGIVVVLEALSIVGAMIGTIIIGAALIVIGGTKLNSHKCTCCDKDR